MAKGERGKVDIATKKAQFDLLKLEGHSINHIAKILGVSRPTCQLWAKEKIKSDTSKRKWELKKIDYEGVLTQRCFDGLVANIAIGISLQNSWLNSFDKKDIKRIEINLDKITRVVGVSADKVLRLIEIRRMAQADGDVERIQIDLRRNLNTEDKSMILNVDNDSDSDSDIGDE